MPRRRLFVSSPEPPVAGAEGGQGLVVALHIEVRPQHLGEEKLGVGTLPQHEVAQPHLAAGADHQVDVRLARGVQVL